MARMKNSRFAHRYVPPAVFAPILLFVLNFVPSYDMGALHECYTSGISAMISFSKKAGTTEFNGYNCKFAITRKESKDGTVSYDGRKFMNLLATIAFQYICG